MSAAFTEFLREYAAKHGPEAEAGKVIVAEWRLAVERLFTQFRRWLTESDPDGVIEIKQQDHELKEDGLGRYRVPRMDLRIFDAWIGILPKARRAVGVARPPKQSAPERAAGRIDITNEILRYVLYRFSREGAEDVWLIDAPFTNTRPKPLDRQAFEAALMSYLR